MANDPKGGVQWGGTFIEAGVLDQVAVDETHAAAVEAKRQADATRAFVLEHFKQLLGCEMPVEIASVQNLPGHSCLIVNDTLLLSYVEAEQMIRSIHERED